MRLVWHDFIYFFFAYNLVIICYFKVYVLPPIVMYLICFLFGWRGGK
jgi:hypothetical protein